jgi:hypothetical protein
MTVKELIEVLSKIEDQETRVMVRGYEGGYNDLIMIDNTPATIYIALDVNEEWYYGAHERVEDVDRDHLDRYHIVKAIIL